MSRRLSESARELLWFSPVYFCVSLLALYLKLRAAPSWYTLLERNHELLLRFQYTNNEQSRLLQFLVPEAIHGLLGLSIPDSYALARLVFVFATLVVFHRYLRRWFDPGESLAGVLLLVVSLAFSFLNDLQESAPLLMLLFLLGLAAIRDNREKAMLAIFLAAGCTNETLLVLPALVFFFGAEANRSSIVRQAARAFLLGSPMVVAIATIRYLTRGQPHLGGAYHWPDNLAGILNDLSLPFFGPHKLYYLSPLLVFHALWVFALLRYREKPAFVRRSLWLIPLFVVPHLITGIFAESRQMIPLGLIVIPASLFTLLRRDPGGGPAVDG